MLFLTLLLLTISIIKLTKGILFKDSLIKMFQLYIKKETGDLNKEYEKELNDEILKVGCLPIIFGIGTSIILAIYLLKAYSIDQYIYPTIIMTVLFILRFTKKNKKCDLTTELDKLEYMTKKMKRGFKGNLGIVIEIVYFSYMFYVLVF